MGVKKTVDLKDFAKELGNFTKSSLKDQKAATVRGLYRSIPDLVKASPVDTGQYAASWDVVVSDLYASIGNFAPYASIIEDGTRPFTPPIGPLLAWAKRVLRDPSQPPDYSPQVWALAKGVQKKIQISGIMPKHIMRDSIPKIVDNIKQEFKKL